MPDENAAVSAYNTLEATSTDNNETTSDHADYFIYNQQPKKVGKDGIPYGEYVQWHISVNDRGSDVAGEVIYNDGFADARNETINGTNGIFVQRGWADATPGADYEYVYNNDGKIIGVRFLPADGSTPNNNTYHITYYTLPDIEYGETAIVHNDAEFDGDTVSYDVVVTGGGNLFDDGMVEQITWQYQTTGDMRNKVTESFVNTYVFGRTKDAAGKLPELRSSSDRG